MPLARRLAVLAVTVLAVAQPAVAQLKSTPVATGLAAPVDFVQDPSDPTVQMIVEQGGRLRVFKNGVVQATDFLNIGSLLPTAPLGERGLLGFAYAPDYATSGRVFVSYTDTNGNSVISRYAHATGNPLQADATTRFDLKWPGGQRYIAQPFTNHNGGHIAFGPDGYLYLGLGDGGSGNDPQHNAQNPLTLLGKMVRVDVAVADNDVEGYDVPASNPFVGQAGVLPEIWAMGLRNPWRWSFDARRAGSTGALIIGDVGQSGWEEVDYEPLGRGGRNYGWGNFEGTHANASYTGGAPYPITLQDPLVEYPHASGTAVIGGYVYRGRLLGPTYVGRYFFGDYGSNKVWSVALTINSATGEATASGLLDHGSELGNGVAGPSAFGVDAAGELYILNYGAGTISRIERASGSPADGCATLDPYLAAGGGVCVAGTWHSPTRNSDLSGDGVPDLVWENGSAQLYSWFMQDRTFTGGAYLTPGQVAPATTAIVGTADLTGDDKPDLLLQDQSTGAVTLWTLVNLTRTAQQSIPIAANTPWRIQATADVDGDGHPDIVWRHTTTGELFVWFMTATGGAASPVTFGYVEDVSHNRMSVPAGWQVMGAADLDGDGRADLVFEHDSGLLAAWMMNGVTALSGVDLTPVQVAPAWRVRALVDLNADQHPDVVWQNVSTGDLYVWYMVGTRFVRGGPLTPGRVNTAWRLMGPK